MESPALLMASRNLARNTLAKADALKQVFALFLFPLPPALVDAATWRHGMHMGMIIQLPVMGMEYDRHAHVGPQMCWT